MTIQTIPEIQDALATLQQRVGGKAHVSVSISHDASISRDPHLSIWPDGIAGGNYRTGIIHVRGEDWDEVFKNAHQKWDEAQAEFERRLINDMAFAIIRLTVEQGECTDAALRADDFHQADIQEYGERAESRANEVSEMGPFEIRPLEGANAA